MGIFFGGNDRGILKLVEWTDSSKDTLVYKVPMDGKRITDGSMITVRESQVAIFVCKGQIADIFPAGLYKLDTDILPVVSKLTGWKYGFRTPIDVDIYYVNTKQFPNIKWGTSNPIMMRDPEFGVIRVRGFGKYSFKVDTPDVFLKELFGTNSSFLTSDITDYLTTIVISGLTDAIGESKVSALDLAGNTMEFQDIVKKSIQDKFKQLGLKLVNLFIENMSVPAEVEKAIDERSRYGVLGDSTDIMMKYAAAEAMKNAASNPGMGGGFMGAGVGMGAGMGMGQMMADAFKPSNNNRNAGGSFCPNCGTQVQAGAKFCPNCGNNMGGGAACPKCGSAVKPGTKFCPNCGNKI